MTNEIRVSDSWDQLSPERKRLVNKLIKSIKNAEKSDKKINDVWAETLEEWCDKYPNEDICKQFQQLKSGQSDRIDE